MATWICLGSFMWYSSLVSQGPSVLFIFKKHVNIGLTKYASFQASGMFYNLKPNKNFTMNSCSGTVDLLLICLNFDSLENVTYSTVVRNFFTTSRTVLCGA